MSFERCAKCTGEWEPVDHETILRELTTEEIESMIWFKATVRTATAKYRRVIPERIIDWAKVQS